VNRIIHDNDAERVEAFLRMADQEFTPPLSQRVDLLEYSVKLAACAENFFAVCDAVDKAHAAVYANDMNTELAFLSSICILPAFRSEKISKPLLDACCRLASERGLRRISLEVDRGNQRAIAFYTRNSFKDCGDAGASGILMTRQL